MKQMILVAFALMSLTAGWAWAEGEVFDLSDELSKGYERPALRAKEILKTPEFTLAALVVKEEIKTHRHQDASHVLYIVSGHGMVTIDDKPVVLKPGTIVHIPKGVPHSIKAEEGEVTFLDFSSHAHSQ
jgi:mannose-6-phosphate isomerase-like protein (cupin superfamily)